MYMRWNVDPKNLQHIFGYCHFFTANIILYKCTTLCMQIMGPLCIQKGMFPFISISFRRLYSAPVRTRFSWSISLSITLFMIFAARWGESVGQFFSHSHTWTHLVLCRLHGPTHLPQWRRYIYIYIYLTWYIWSYSLLHAPLLIPACISVD